MGGLGSGRPCTSRFGTVEGCPALDVNWLNRRHRLQPGWSGSLSWTFNGEKIGAIRLRANADRLTLSYRISADGGEWESLTESVLIVRVPCRYGGARPYFICPGNACGRRVVKLYLAHCHFRCRDCAQLAYACQRESAFDRKLRRANKARERLSRGADSDDICLPRPKGMWKRTYERLYRRACEADEALIQWLGDQK